jgi:hypothetical protein
MSLMHEPALPNRSMPPRAEGGAPVPPRSGVVFVTSAASESRVKELVAAGHIIAKTARVGVPQTMLDVPSRGGLRDAVEGAIELALALRGALPPNVAVGCEAREMAKDQLFRVRTLGAKGLCVVIGELSRLVDEDGVLEATDSEILRVWRTLAEDEAVTVLLDDGDRGVSLLAPVALDEWHVPVLELEAPTSLRWPDDERSVDDELDRESGVDFGANELLLDGATSDEEGDDRGSQLPLFRTTRATRTAEEKDRPTMRDAIRGGQAKRVHESEGGVHVMRHDPLAGLDDEDALISEAFEAMVGTVLTSGNPSNRSTDDGLPAVDEKPIAKTEPPAGAEPRTKTEARTRATTTPTATEAADPQRRRATAPTMRREPKAPPVTTPSVRDERIHEAARPVASAVATSESAADAVDELPRRKKARGRGLDATAIRDHSATLTTSRGSRPVKQIEQLFAEHYAPLLEAVSAGQGDREAERALAAWRASFEKSYQESFATIRLTGKRPKMVLDAPEEAVRIGRQAGARSAQLVLVDGMRFGLGERVQRRLEASMGDIGVCVERSLLWSALPSVTSVQMQLLSQGARGLREIEKPSERDLTAFRDGTACIPRRERIGQRDLLKLDVVEARLRDVGGEYEGRMDDLADEIADALVKVAEGLSPRTLLYVFGDHGFHLRIPSRGRTGAAEQGGARPEEILVPGYAWLVGGSV